MSSRLLRTFTTMKIGGSAEKIVLLSEIEDIHKVSHFPKPLRILGNGSNTLIDDRGLKGTVIVTREASLPEPKVLEENENFVCAEFSAGSSLPAVARWAQNRGLTGAEYMVGVPGTIGGALVQNAGANDQEFSQVFESARVLDLESAAEKRLVRAEAALTYRSSSFHKNSGRELIASAVLKFPKGDREKITRQTDLNLEYRKSKTPYAKPSLGSIFTRIRPVNSQGDSWIYPGKVIEDLGLKGFAIGGARISPVHANYIVNETGAAQFEDVMELIELIENKAREKFQIEMQREILIWTDKAALD